MKARIVEHVWFFAQCAAVADARVDGIPREFGRRKPRCDWLLVMIQPYAASMAAIAIQPKGTAGIDLPQGALPAGGM